MPVDARLEPTWLSAGADARPVERAPLSRQNRPVRWKAGQPIRVYAVDL